MVSVPRPPARSEGIHSPLQRGGDGGGAVDLGAGGRGTETTVLLRFARLTIVKQGLRALFSSKKRGYLLPSPTGRGKPPNGGAGEGLLIWGSEHWHEVVLYIYSFSCINIQYEEWVVKPIKLQSESMGFRL